MELAYNYIAKNSSGQKLSGVVYAKNKPLAFALLKKGGLAPLTVAFSLGATIEGTLRPDFNKQELSRFYMTVGKRLAAGKSMVSGLDGAIEYVNDPRLKQGIVLMKQAISDGQSEYAAMQLAGFPKRDALVIRSTAEAGKTAQSFVALGDEIARLEGLRKSLASTFRIPAMMGTLMVIFIWAALVFIAPGTIAFLKQTGLKLNLSTFIVQYFALVGLFNKSVVLSSIVYFSGFYAVVRFLKSSVFKSFLDKFPSIKALSLKSDQAALWNSFTLLYDAAVPAREAAAIVSSSANRPDSRASFQKLSKLVEAGRALDDAARTAGFPRFVVAGVSAAASSGDIVSGLNDMTKGLEEDVQVLTSVIQDNAKIYSTLLMGTGILLVFVLTYYPMIASVMANV